MSMLRRRIGIVLLLSVLAMGGGVCDENRISTYNVERLGITGSTEWNALVDVLIRVDADVAMIQEVNGADERDRVPDLADAAGYPYSATSSISGTMSGNLRTACLSRLPILRYESWSSVELSGDPNANDIGRDIFACWVDPGGDLSPWVVLTVHLKASPGDPNLFRRQIEVQRTVQAIEVIRSSDPGSPIVLAGDFNEDPGRGPFGSPTWNAPPPGLPASYRLGNDITFPVTYDPFVTLADAGMTLRDAAHEDDPATVITHPATNRRIDLLFTDMHVGLDGSEVYDSCKDDGVDSPPPGNWLPKAGAPLPCGRSTDAADHLDVFGDMPRLAVDQDGDLIDDSIDCAALDPSAGTPPEIEDLRATPLPNQETRFSWGSVPTADRYDTVRGDLGQWNSGVCVNDSDPDTSDTIYDEIMIPAVGTGWYYLVRAVDDGCGGPGPWGTTTTGTFCAFP